jgi:hypothetical protein
VRILSEATHTEHQAIITSPVVPFWSVSFINDSY